jgi:hypothetical protein
VRIPSAAKDVVSAVNFIRPTDYTPNAASV